MQPLVSIILPIYNGENTIDLAIETINAQTYPNIEVVIVNDGSTDGTLERINRRKQDFKHSVTLINQSNQGVSAARNTAIRAARGKYIAPLDCDDIWASQKIEKQVQELERFQGPDLAMCLCGYEDLVSDKNGVLLHKGERLPHRRPTRFLKGGHSPTVWLVPRVAFSSEQVGLFNPEIHSSEDTDFLCRFMQKGGLFIFTKGPPLATYHCVVGKTYRNMRESGIAFLKQNGAWLARNYPDFLTNWIIYQEERSYLGRDQVVKKADEFLRTYGPPVFGRFLDSSNHRRLTARDAQIEGWESLWGSRLAKAIVDFESTLDQTLHKPLGWKENDLESRIPSPEEMDGLPDRERALFVGLTITVRNELKQNPSSPRYLHGNVRGPNMLWDEGCEKIRLYRPAISFEPPEANLENIAGISPHFTQAFAKAYADETGRSLNMRLVWTLSALNALCKLHDRHLFPERAPSDEAKQELRKMLETSLRELGPLDGPERTQTRPTRQALPKRPLPSKMPRQNGSTVDALP